MKTPPKARAAASLNDVLAALEKRGSRKNRDGMARYGIVSDKVYGVSVAQLHQLAKQLGRNHALALALWDTGWYEARMLAVFVAEPSLVTATLMDRWCRDFDNWAICDTVIMHLFDRTPHAWSKATLWCGRKDEFVKRAGFAMFASLALHDKQAPDRPFLAALKLVERHATDERNFVRKAVNWALRSIGSRNPALHASAVRVAKALAASEDPTARWNGKDALRHLASSATARRVARGAHTTSRS